MKQTGSIPTSGSKSRPQKKSSQLSSGRGSGGRSHLWENWSLKTLWSSATLSKPVANYPPDPEPESRDPSAEVRKATPKALIKGRTHNHGHCSTSLCRPHPQPSFFQCKISVDRQNRTCHTSAPRKRYPIKPPIQPSAVTAGDSIGHDEHNETVAA